MLSIILYFGSFNPIHTAHLTIAKYATTLADEVWLVVSPHNPLKRTTTLASENDRLLMTEQAIRAVDESGKIKVCDIEFSLPRPSYTYQTLKELRKIYPQTKFSMIMGTDNLQEIEKWKNYTNILESTHLYIYPRDGYYVDKKLYTTYNITYIEDVKTLAVSSTQIRTATANTTDILPETKKYITDHNLY
ncbi:MAG: nicotinate (nicotinamide) nucleotide adenylyltransferase [Rikenellaceae bacterium]